jgi:peptide/nickel transport system ATP-binding protein
VEYGNSSDVFERPLHPYTKLLTESLPVVGDAHARQGVAGRPPSLWDDLRGCRFADRCPLVMEICQTTEPALKEYRPGHLAACHAAEALL